VSTRVIRSAARRGLFMRDGVWWVDVRVNGRRYREKAGRTEKEARDYRDDLKSWGRKQKKTGMDADKPEGQPLTFDKLAADYIRLYASKKKSCLRDERAIDALKGFFSGRHLADINLRAVQEYRLFRDGVNGGTRNREIACLKTMLRQAVEWQMLRAYPLPAKGVLEKVRRFEPYILSYAEAERLIAKAKPEWLRLAIIGYLYTGLRRMELLSLKREHVDFPARMLTVVAANAKSGKSRKIPLDDRALEALRAADGKTYFFENPATGKPYTNIHPLFKKALVAAEIPTRCRVHDLRHSYGTWQIVEGTDVRTLSELMGHASPMITLELYCHSNLELKRRAAGRLPDIVKNGQFLQTAPADAPATVSESVN